VCGQILFRAGALGSFGQAGEILEPKRKQHRLPAHSSRAIGRTTFALVDSQARSLGVARVSGEQVGFRQAQLGEKMAPLVDRRMGEGGEKEWSRRGKKLAPFGRSWKEEERREARMASDRQIG